MYEFNWFRLNGDRTYCVYSWHLLFDYKIPFLCPAFRALHQIVCVYIYMQQYRVFRYKYLRDVWWYHVTDCTYLLDNSLAVQFSVAYHILQVFFHKTTGLILCLISRDRTAYPGLYHEIKRHILVFIQEAIVWFICHCSHGCCR